MVTSMSVSPLYLTLLALGAILLSYVVPYLVNTNGLRSYPGPIFAKFTSVWLAWIIKRGRWSKTVEELHRTHGPFVRLSPNHISVADPNAFNPVYGHSSGAMKAPFYDAFSNFRKRTVFNTCSRAEHARKRHVESHMFAPQSVRALESTSRVHVAELLRQFDALCSRVEKAAKGESMTGRQGSSLWSVRDGRVWFSCMAWYGFRSFDTIGDLSFGSPFGMLRAGNDITKIAKSPQKGLQAFTLVSSGVEPEKLGLELEDLSVVESLTARTEIAPVLGFLPAYIRPFVARLPGFRRGSDAATRLASLAITSVMRRLAAADSREDMLQRLLDGRDEEGNPMDPEELSAEALTLIIAGADTTANTTCAITHFLARDQYRQAKLQAELDSAFASIDGDIAPYDVVKRLPYLDAVIDEGLRLHSTVGAGLPRIVPPGGMTVLGQTFKEGTWISVPIYTVHRSEAVWGENAHQFCPERWIEPDSARKKQMMDAFAPFSIGPRACIGRNLALMQLHIIVATIFHRYHFVVEDDAELAVHDALARRPVKCVVGMKHREFCA
ncbi:cytochrome P450 [Laetiporus sulphureus 93-53]|uniref:Cytochrome P450 n=1 Tax=Laetiporus sulphureus 93-53 TaxID=1314785 RepID=A0A165G9W4_9APHY|nr:cytochrome P450 [Laetiporus sulphureus 93-53]KZT10043.1 cytochrome P450 [Laetiporus sulphureus 93-53]